MQHNTENVYDIFVHTIDRVNCCCARFASKWYLSAATFFSSPPPGNIFGCSRTCALCCWQPRSHIYQNRKRRTCAVCSVKRNGASISSAIYTFHTRWFVHASMHCPLFFGRTGTSNDSEVLGCVVSAPLVVPWPMLGWCAIVIYYYFHFDAHVKLCMHYILLARMRGSGGEGAEKKASSDATCIRT